MNKIVFASMREGAGKTSIILGITQAIGKKVGYMKPFGDRIAYKKKKIWDYDVDLMTGLYGLEDTPEQMCFGFDHSKFSYGYDSKGMREKLLAAVDTVGSGKELLFIEGGRDLIQGTHIHLGSLSLAKHTGSKLVVVISGSNDLIVDDIAFLKKYLDQTKIKLAGIIINKVKDPTEFKKIQLPVINEIGIPVLGVIPYFRDLTRFSVSYLADVLSAKIITGEENMDAIIEDILVGAMSVDAPLQKILSQNKNILMITSGDRSDMILTAIERNTRAIVLTNDILPPTNIISKAEARQIPVLMVPTDTYKTAKMIDEMVALTMASEKKKIQILGKIAKKEIDLRQLVKND